MVLIIFNNSLICGVKSGFWQVANILLPLHGILILQAHRELLMPLHIFLIFLYQFLPAFQHANRKPRYAPYAQSLYRSHN